MNTLRAIFASAVLCILAAGGALAQEKKIAVIPVKYDGLKQEILKHRGKVVVVDFWATFCPPCMAAFPKFIALHEKHGDKGLVVISVSLDDVQNAEAVEIANDFLTKRKSPLRNLILDESDKKIWHDKFGFSTLPCYFVFDRQGRWVRFRSQDYDPMPVPYTEIEKTIVQMLQEK